MIRLPRLPAAVAVAVLVALGLASDGASAAPRSLPDGAVDIDLKSASVRNVFLLLGRVGKTNITLDPCVQGTVDLRLKNTPLPLVFDALALKLGLVYEEDDGGGITVRCAGQDASTNASLGVKVSLAERGAALPDVLDRLATAAKLDGVDYRASRRPNVELTLKDVRVSTAVSALRDTTGLQIAVAKRRLVVTD